MNYNWTDPRRGVLANAPHKPSLCVIARAETLPGADEEVETLLAELADDVRLAEPGCLSYTVTRAMGSRSHFAVHARFRGWHSFQRHSVTPHMKEKLPELTALLASAVSLEIFLEV